VSVIVPTYGQIRLHCLSRFDRQIFTVFADRGDRCRLMRGMATGPRWTTYAASVWFEMKPIWVSAQLQQSGAGAREYLYFLNMNAGTEGLGEQWCPIPATRWHGAVGAKSLSRRRLQEAAGIIWQDASG